MQSVNVAKVSKQQNTGGDPRLARDLTQVLFLACNTILLCMITWKWKHGAMVARNPPLIMPFCVCLFVCFVLFCFLLPFFLFPKNYENWNSTNFKQFWTDYTFKFNNTFYYCIVWHMYVQVKYFFYSIQTKTWVPHMNNKQRNKIYMYKRFTV